MVTLNISIPENILFALRENTTEFSSNMKRYTALKLYESEKLSLGQATELAGIDKHDFIKLLSENNISIFSHMTITDLERDAKNA